MDLTKKFGVIQDVQRQLDEHVPIKVTLETVNILLHMIGMCLLVSTLKRGQKNSQHFCLINLSATQILKNISFLVLNIFNIRLINYIPKLSMEKISQTMAIKDLKELTVWMNDMKAIVWDVNRLTDASGYVVLLAYTSFYWIYMFAMFHITADRLIAAAMNIQYKTLCTVRRTITVIACSWALLFVVPAVAISSVYYTYEHEERLRWWVNAGFRADISLLVTLVYVPACLNIAFLLFAIISYLLMFIKYVRTERKISPSKRSVFQMFRNSKFYVALLIITSFLLLVVIPSIVFFVLTTFTTNISSVPLWLQICMRVSDTCDAVIYFFLYAPVQKLWMSLCGHCGPSDQRRVVASDLDRVSSRGTDSEPLNSERISSL